MPMARPLVLPPGLLTLGAQAAGVMGARLGGAAANVAAVLLLARAMPPGEVGTVLAGLAASQLGALAGTGGREALAIRVLPQCLGSDEAAARAYLRGLVRRLAWQGPLAGAGAGAVLMATAGAGLAEAALVLLATMLLAALKAGVQSVQAAGAVARGGARLSLVRPLVFLGLLAGLDAVGALAAAPALGAAAFSSLLALSSLAPHLARLPLGRGPETASPGWGAEARRLLLTMLLLGEAGSLVLLAAGLTLGEAALASFGVALRYAALVQLGTSAMVAAIGPKLSHAWGQGDLPEALRLGRLVPRVSVPLVGGGVLLVWVLAEPLMGVFGSAYREDAWALRLLVLMPLVTSLFGPSLLVLTAAGRAGQAARAALPATLGLGAGAALGGLWGASGAAAGAVLAHPLWEAGLALRLARGEGLVLAPGPLGALLQRTRRTRTGSPPAGSAGTARTR